MLRFDFDLRPLLLVVIPSILAFFGLLLARLDIVLNKHVRVYIRFCQNSMSFLHNLIILALRWRSIALTDFSGGFFFALLVHLVLCLSKLFIIFRFADGLPSFCGFTGLGILQFGWTYCTNWRFSLNRFLLLWVSYTDAVYLWKATILWVIFIALARCRSLHLRLTILVYAKGLLVGVDWIFLRIRGCLLSSSHILLDQRILTFSLLWSILSTILSLLLDWLYYNIALLRLFFKLW